MRTGCKWRDTPLGSVRETALVYTGVPIAVTAVHRAFGDRHIQRAGAGKLHRQPAQRRDGAAAGVQRPLATVVIDGIVTSSILTWLLLPSLYGWLIRGNWTGQGPARAHHSTGRVRLTRFAQWN